MVSCSCWVNLELYLLKRFSNLQMWYPVCHSDASEFSRAGNCHPAFGCCPCNFSILNTKSTVPIFTSRHNLTILPIFRMSKQLARTEPFRTSGSMEITLESKHAKTVNTLDDGTWSGVRRQRSRRSPSVLSSGNRSAYPMGTDGITWRFVVIPSPNLKHRKLS